jgi:hypothetical protein
MKRWRPAARHGTAGRCHQRVRGILQEVLMNGLTIDGAIRALQRAREQVGGDAPLLMVDGLPVHRLEAWAQNWHRAGPCVYVSDAAPEPDPQAAS